MDIPFAKKLIIAGGVLFLLSIFSFSLTTFSQDSCIGENSTLDDVTCIVGEQAELENSITVNESTYGNYRINETGNITEEGNWESVNTEYNKSFSNRFYESGEYQYQMFVSENQSFENPDEEFIFTFNVVKADDPDGPLSSFKSYISSTIEELVSDLFEMFQNREIGTPTVE